MTIKLNNQQFINQVMHQVALRQKKRLFIFTFLVVASFIGVLFLLGIFGYRVWFSATNEGVIDFFQAVVEDYELLKTTWQEVLVLFWQEFEKIFLIVFGLGLIILLILIKKRQKISNLPKNFKEVKHYLKEESR